jgi:hypothetical protein
MKKTLKIHIFLILYTSPGIKRTATMVRSTAEKETMILKNSKMEGKCK